MKNKKVVETFMEDYNTGDNAKPLRYYVRKKKTTAIVTDTF